MSKAESIVLDSETGARNPDSKIVANLILIIAFSWSIFQLYVSSPLVLEITPWMNADVVKRFHLIFAGFLAFLSYPAFKNSPRYKVPIIDYIMGFAIVIACSYLIYSTVWDSAAFEMRLGLPNTADVIFSITGIIFLLEATRRALGPPLTIVAILALSYAFFGFADYGGASINKLISHMWITTEGVFGVAIGVSSTMVFLFVLFGALLEQAGAGNYFIRVSFALMGHFRGGPAKAAVVSSALTGMISGSSIANVVTTGTFTIPLMKKVGFSAEKAGAIEVASSTNGQLTPPIMGAAAFLMVEYVGIPFVEIIKHAFLPAIISYIALVYIVHLEALKANMQGLKRVHKIRKIARVLGILSVVLVLGFLVFVLPPIIDFIKYMAGDNTFFVIILLLLVSYFALLYISSNRKDLPNDDITEIPKVAETVLSGLHFLLPVVVLVWLLTVERLSPDTSAFWATIFMIFIVLTQKTIINFFRKTIDFKNDFILAKKDLITGLINGGKSMIGIGVATATAGLIVGTVTLTGIGQVIIGFVEFISGGNIFIILLLTAVISLILGMGLPTTANYIVVSSLMAPVILSLGAANDIAIPLIAAHMFVFYFGILADDTPPVGLAAFAASAISKGDPIKTGLQGFAYDIRTAILPFLFIFNTQLLMIGIDSILEFVLVVISSVIAMLVFASSTQNFFIVRNKIWETLALLLVAFTLFRPGFFWDEVQPPYEYKNGNEIFQVAENIKPYEDIVFSINGLTIEGVDRTYTFALPIENGKTGLEKINNTGMELVSNNGVVEVMSIMQGMSSNNKINKQIEAMKIAGVDSSWVVKSVRVPADRINKQIMFIPAILLLLFIYFMQRRRKNV
jgi:TRAP transporter 4TM/12TM fusion protein